jgi:hypothetical protein
MKRAKLLLVPVLVGVLAVPGVAGVQQQPAAAVDRVGEILEFGPVFHQLRASQGGVAEVPLSLLFSPPVGQGWTWRANIQVWRDDHFVTTVDLGPVEPGPLPRRVGTTFQLINPTKGVYTVGPSTVTVDYTDGRPGETFIDETRGHVVIKDASSLRLSGKRPSPRSAKVQFTVRARNVGTGNPWPAAIVTIRTDSTGGRVTVARVITGFDGVGRVTVNQPRRRVYQAVSRANATTFQNGSKAIFIPAAR